MSFSRGDGRSSPFLKHSRNYVSSQKGEMGWKPFKSPGNATELYLVGHRPSQANGVEAANRIPQVAPEAAIILLTQNSDKDMVRAALKTGAQGYVLKKD